MSTKTMGNKEKRSKKVLMIGVLIGILSVAFCVMVYSIVNMLIGGDNDSSYAEDGDPAQFNVLEIVPDESMASFGYLVGGQEPIAIADMLDSNGVLNKELSSYILNTSTGPVPMADTAEFASVLERWLKAGKDDDGKTFTKDMYDKYEEVTNNGVKSQYGTYEYDSSDKGDYVLERKAESWIRPEGMEYVLAKRYVPGSQYYVVNGEPIAYSENTTLEYAYRQYMGWSNNANYPIYVYEPEQSGNMSGMYNVSFKKTNVTNAEFESACRAITYRHIKSNHKYYVKAGDPAAQYTKVHYELAGEYKEGTQYYEVTSETFVDGDRNRSLYIRTEEDNGRYYYEYSPYNDWNLYSLTFSEVSIGEYQFNNNKEKFAGRLKNLKYYVKVEGENDVQDYNDQYPEEHYVLAKGYEKDLDFYEVESVANCNWDDNRIHFPYVEKDGHYVYQPEGDGNRRAVTFKKVKINKEQFENSSNKYYVKVGVASAGYSYYKIDFDKDVTILNSELCTRNNEGIVLKSPKDIPRDLMEINIPKEVIDNGYTQLTIQGVYYNEGGLFNFKYIPKSSDDEYWKRISIPTDPNDPDNPDKQIIKGDANYSIPNGLNGCKTYDLDARAIPIRKLVMFSLVDENKWGGLQATIKSITLEKPKNQPALVTPAPRPKATPVPTKTPDFNKGYMLDFENDINDKADNKAAYTLNDDGSITINAANGKGVEFDVPAGIDAEFMKTYNCIVVEYELEKNSSFTCKYHTSKKGNNDYFWQEGSSVYDLAQGGTEKTILLREDVNSSVVGAVDKIVIAGKGSVNIKSVILTKADKYSYRFIKRDRNNDGVYDYDGVIYHNTFSYKGTSYAKSREVDGNPAAKEEYVWNVNYSIVREEPDNTLETARKDGLKGKVRESIMAIFKEPEIPAGSENEVYTNTEMFKKYGVGLAYKDNDVTKGEDVDSYEFMGWYYDKYGVNEFDDNRRLNKDTTLYAKWKAVYPSRTTDTCKVTFDANMPTATPAPGSEPDTAPFKEVEIKKGGNIVMPDREPCRAGYVFDGWYTDKKCNTKYDFTDYSEKIEEDMTLYAGWTDMNEFNGRGPYTIEFDANTDFWKDKSGKNKADDVVTGMPVTVENYFANGYLEDLTLPPAAGADDAYNAASAAGTGTIPERKGYSFAGWYYNKACTKAFRWGETLADTIPDDRPIILYAKWVSDDDDAYRITLEPNRPEDAVNVPEMIAAGNISASVVKKDGKYVITAENSGFINIENKVNEFVSPFSREGDFALSLEGNIGTKLENYSVNVVTRTPQGIMKERDLIDKADLIVINQTVNNGLIKLWNQSHSRASAGKLYSFDVNDIDWETALRIWRKVSVGPEENGSSIAPLIFDYNVYNNTGRGDTVTQTRRFADGKSELMAYEGASSNNMFKLYLVTRQMNPVTLYRAYIRDSYDGADGNNNGWSGCRIDSEGQFWNEGNDSGVMAWNESTLLPYEAMRLEEYNGGSGKAYEQTLMMLGYDVNNDLYETDTDASVMYRSLVTYGTSENNTTMLANFVNMDSRLMPDGDMDEYMQNLWGGKSSNVYSMADGVSYLLHSDITKTNIENNLSFLEIEPSDNKAAYKDEVFWHWYLARFVTNFSGKITVDNMSSSEFVGNIADLNAKYNAIYIGADLSGMSENARDFLPEGYSYAHSGRVEEKNDGAAMNMRGTIGDKDKDKAVNNFVYSGNDITRINMEKLIQYADVGYPVIFGCDMLKSREIIGTDKVVNSGMISPKVDNSSYIYELMCTLIGDGRADTMNCFFENQNSSPAQKKRFITAISAKKFEIELTDRPTEYKDRESKQYRDVNLSDSDIYINPGGGGKVLSYTLKIHSSSKGNYAAKLYIDINADGKYSAEEQLDSLDIYDNTSKKYVRYNKLVREHEYIISREVEDYVGVLPWSIDIIDTSNEGIRCNESGMCAIKTDASNDNEKEVINVLQLYAEDTDFGHNNWYDCNNNLYLPEGSIDEPDSEIGKAYALKGEITRENMYTYFEYIKKEWDDHGFSPHTAKSPHIENDPAADKRDNIIRNSGMFYYYMTKLSEYEIRVKRISVNKFQEAVKESISKAKKHNATASGSNKMPESYFKQNDVNMLIIGFADRVTDITEKAARDQIEEFISEGNTTLFTHDTTSLFNGSWKIDADDGDKGKFPEQYQFTDNNGITQTAEAGGTIPGYFMNEQFRDIFGMDRYDVTRYKTEDATYSSILKDASDYVYEAGSGRSKCYTSKNKVLTQGFTNYPINARIGVDCTHLATKSNEGQIVSYPYEISDALPIARTHSQWYQLDMEDDDIVVWYSLYQGIDDAGYYNFKNDVRNNYYIYNKGNITYSGVGHDADMSEDEVKLFVNTMVAAYNSKARAAKPFVTNSDKSAGRVGDNEIDYLYVDFDASSPAGGGSEKPFGEGIKEYNAKGAAGNNGLNDGTGKAPYYAKRTYFKVKNYSIVSKKKMIIHYYPMVIDSAGDVVKAGGELNLNTYVYDPDGDKPDELVSRKNGLVYVDSNSSYYVDVPIDSSYYSDISYTDKYTGETKTFGALDAENRFMIQIEVEMRYGSDSTVEPGTRTVSYVRRGNFKLD